MDWWELGIVDLIGNLAEKRGIYFLNKEHKEDKQLTLCFWEIAESEKRESLQETIVNF